MYKVIIADDEPLIQEGFREIVEWDELRLELAGVASNGKEAYELIESVHPHILITDIKMPVMDGLELIKKARSNGIRLKIIILSGYSDYHLLQQAIRCDVDSYLLKPINQEELRSLLVGMVEELEQDIRSQIQDNENLRLLWVNTFNRLIQNQISDKEFKDKAKLLQFRPFESEVRAVVALPQPKQPERFRGDESLQAFAVANIVDELREAGGLAGAVFPDYRGRVVALIERPSGGWEDVKTWCEECADRSERYLKCTLHVAMGRPSNELRTLADSYLSAVDLLHYHCFQGPAVLESSEHPESSEVPLDYPRIQALVQALEREELQALTDHWMQRWLELPVIRLDRLRAGIMEWVVVMMRALEAVLPPGRSNVVLGSSAGYEELLEFRRHDQFRSWLRNLIDSMMESAVTSLHSKEKLSRLAEDCVAIVNRRYRESITLKQVADELYVNSSYLGQLFRKEVGTSFTDYVNQLRIQEATRLLTVQSGIKIYEAAQEVGYSDAQYFAKLFKKYTGMSPTDMRR